MNKEKNALFVRLLLPISFIITGIILFVSLEGCYTQETSAADALAQGNEEQKARIALDVGIVVSDMDTSLGFYRDLLGLPVVAEVRTSLIGAGTMVQLKHGASLIKLLEMDVPPTTKTQNGITGAFGHRYVTLMVSDITPFVSRMSENEVPTPMPLTELGNGAKIMMVEDPDGNIVEFVEEAK